MPRDPGSLWVPLPEAGAPDGLVKTQFIVHSTGSRASAAANRRYFERPEVAVESTFIVGLDSSDPTLQVMDSTDRADANGAANGRGISVEVVGLGTDPFTAWQVQEVTRLGRWAADTHGIARRIIPAEAAPGYGWHVMFGAPGPWTSVRGKVCPGTARIKQLRELIFPAIFAANLEDDDMPSAQEIAEAVWGYGIRNGVQEHTGSPQAAAPVLGEMFANLRTLANRPPAQMDAAAIAAAIPGDLARQVVDLLAARLAD